MTRKEQNKILDAKIASSVNQYKVDRLNVEISDFLSGDLNKFEFLKRIDLNYKPNVLDKARFEFSPLGKTFSIGLDKTAQGYQEEGIIKLLKDIRDGLAGGIIPRAPRGSDLDRPNDDSDDDDDDDDDYDYDDDDGDDDDEQKRLSKLLGELRTNEDNEEFRNEAKKDKLDKFANDNNMFNLETEEATLNKFKEMVRNKEDEINKTFEDKKNRLNNLNNNVKKIKDYIKENNNELNTIKHKLDHTENERNNLLLNRNQLYSKLKETENELYETKKRLEEAKDNTNKKINILIN